MNRRSFMIGAAAGPAALATSAFNWPGVGDQPRENLLVAGSASFKRFTDKLGGAFSAQNPVDVISEGGGTTSALIALTRGAIDVASLSREIRRHEDHSTIRSWLVGKDAVGFMVSPSNPVRNLGRSQVRDILGGRITNWAEVGGPSGAIDVVSRPANSTTRGWIEETLMGDLEITRRAQLVADAKRVAPAVAANPRAIGYAAHRSVSAEVTVLTIGDVPMLRQTIYSGRYPLARPLYYAVRLDAPRMALDFINFVHGRVGQELLEPEVLRVS